MKYLLVKLLGIASAFGLVIGWGHVWINGGPRWPFVLGAVSFGAWTAFVVLDEQEDARKRAEAKYERVKQYLEKNGYI